MKQIRILVLAFAGASVIMTVVNVQFAIYGILGAIFLLLFEQAMKRE